MNQISNIDLQASFTKCNKIQLQSVELCSLGASVDTTLVFDTLKHRELQFIMDTIDLDTKLHNILKLNLKY